MNGGADKQRPVRVRFAPSPTGTLHVGSARTALYNYLFARSRGGSFILRIEDTDTSRSRREHERSLLEDLAWLGLEWDEGPDRGGERGPYRQSERLELYRRRAAALVEQGAAYHCFCSRERLQELKESSRRRGEPPRYDGRCAGIGREEARARLAAGEAATVRFRVPGGQRLTVDDVIHGAVEFDTDLVGDFIIVRSDGTAAYNFAVVVDDAAMGITHVIRGEDHLTNTARQLLLFQALGEQPPRYAHHSLILGPDGGKLSKRHGATSVGDFRRRGYLPQAIVNYLALLSWSPGEGREQMTLAEMISQFDLEAVSSSPAIFDAGKLDWLNGLYIRELDPAGLRQAVDPFLGAGPGVSEGRLAVALAAIQTALVTLDQAPAALEAFFAPVPPGGGEAAAELELPGAAAVLEMLLERLDELPDMEDLPAAEAEAAIAAARELLKSLRKQCKEEGIAPRVLFRTLRIALTGCTSGPEVPYLLAGLGREEVRRRLAAARNRT